MRRTCHFLMIVGIAAVLYGCGRTETAQPSEGVAAVQSTEENMAHSTELAGTGETVQETGGQGLPEYVYTGEDPYIGGICEYFSEQEADKERGDVYIPIPLVLKISVSASEGEKALVHGSFCDAWYELDGKNLFCVNYGENTGLLYMEKIDGFYKVTRFEKVRDGGDYPEDWKRLCKGDEELYESLFQREEYENKREAVRREIIARYVEDNGLDIETYQDYGWEPQRLADPVETESGINHF